MVTIPEGSRRLRDDESKRAGDSALPDDEQRNRYKTWIRPFDDEWHDHDGGEMPVHGDTRIDLEYECDGHVYRATVLARQCLHLWRFNPNEAGGIKYLRYRRHRCLPQEPSVPQVAKEAYSISVTSLVTICQHNVEQLRVCSQADGYIAITDSGKCVSVSVPVEAVSYLIKALEVCRERCVSAEQSRS